MADDFELVESSDDGSPKYDVNTNTVTEGGEKRPADLHEVVRAVTMRQKADRDPMERYRQTAERNGTTIPDVLRKISEFEQISDPVERLSHINRAYGINDQAAASELYLRAVGQSQTQHPTAPTQSQVNAVNDFNTRHPDALSQSLRPYAAQLMANGDKRLKGARTDSELIDKAMAAAWFDRNPTAKASQKIQAKFHSRDEANEAMRRARKIDKAIG